MAEKALATTQQQHDAALAEAKVQHEAALAEASAQHAAALAAAREEPAAAAAIAGSAAAAGEDEAAAAAAAAAATAAASAAQQELEELRAQLAALQRENASLVEAERQTAAELTRRLNEIAARGQQAAESRVEAELLSSAVETVQVHGCCCSCALASWLHVWHASRGPACLLPGHHRRRYCRCLLERLPCFPCPALPQAHVSELQEALAGREQELAELEAELAALRRSSGGDSPGGERAAAMADGDAVREQQAELQERAEAAEAALAAAQAVAAEAGERAAAAQQQAEQLQGRVQVLERSCEAALQQAEAAEAAAEAAAASGSQEAEGRLHEAQQQAASLQEQVAQLQQQLGEAQQAAAAQQTRADELAAALAAAQQELQQLQQRQEEQGSLSAQPSESLTEPASAPGSPTRAAAAAASDAAALQAECARLAKELQVGQGHAVSAGRFCRAGASTPCFQTHTACFCVCSGDPSALIHTCCVLCACRTPSASLCWWPRRSSRSTLPGASAVGLTLSNLCWRCVPLRVGNPPAGVCARPHRWFDTELLAPCRTKALEEQLAAAEAGCAQIEQQLAVAHSQLADSRALMDSTQVRGGRFRLMLWQRLVACSRLWALAGPVVGATPSAATAVPAQEAHPRRCLQPAAWALPHSVPPTPPISARCPAQSSVHSQLAQWKALADEKEGRLAAAAEKVLPAPCLAATACCVPGCFCNAQLPGVLPYKP